MLHYLYLDYGGLARYRRELKYSLISLRSELGSAAGEEQKAGIAVYTDAPDLYARWPVEVVNIASQVQAWSGGGIYPHRIKPAVVLDALTRFATPVCFLDSDSIIQPGFHAEIAAKRFRDPGDLVSLHLQLLSRPVVEFLCEETMRAAHVANAGHKDVKEYRRNGLAN